MAKQLKKWQGWLLFGGAMVIVFVLGLICSSLLERRAEVASIFNTRVRDKVSMQTVLTALIFQHKQAEPQVYCQKSNRLLGQNIGS